MLTVCPGGPATGNPATDNRKLSVCLVAPSNTATAKIEVDVNGAVGVSANSVLEILGHRLASLAGKEAIVQT